jgi:hypothetical protein
MPALWAFAGLFRMFAYAAWAASLMGLTTVGSKFVVMRLKRSVTGVSQS